VAWITINRPTALHLYYQTDEAMEGRNAFVEKRGVDFRKFRQ
jgi:naphthoate synthase